MFSTTKSSIMAFAAALLLADIASASYVPGRCGMHINQETRRNNDDYVTFTIKDNDGNTIGTQSGGLSDASPITVDSQLPSVITCTQPANSHDISCTYDGYTFGTDSGCSIGKWNDGNQGTRQGDCGFAC